MFWAGDGRGGRVGFGGGLLGGFVGVSGSGRCTRKSGILGCECECILGWSGWECGRSPLSSGLLSSVSGCGLRSLGLGRGHRVWWLGGRG